MTGDRIDHAGIVREAVPAQARLHQLERGRQAFARPGDDLKGLARDGFQIKFYDTLEEFYLAEALEYIDAWRQATDDFDCYSNSCNIFFVNQCSRIANASTFINLNCHGSEVHGMQEDVYSTDFPATIVS